MASKNDMGSLSLSEVLELTRLFEEFQPRLLAMVRARIDPALEARVGADAILQEVFLTARRRWRDRPAAEAMSPYAWLVWLTRQSLIDAWRREHADREMPLPEKSAMQLSGRLFAQGTTPSGALMRGEIQRVIRRALEALDPIDREIIWLIDFDGLAYREAARILGIKENAAHVRHFRALRRLREFIPESMRPDGP
jgi:RNA polymerase sigma-70 factor (ECF subfamily)